MSFFHAKRGLAAIVAAAVTMAFALSEPASAGTCRKAVSEAEVDAKISARFRELQCQLDGDPSVKLNVKFQTLGESAASVLLYKGKAPFTEKLYGKTKVLENAVLKEYRTLLDKFGSPDRYEGAPGEGSGIGFSVVGTEQPPQPSSFEYAPKGVVQSYRLPASTEGPFYEEILHILKEPTFPLSLNLSYGTWDPEAAKGELGTSVGVWRYGTRADVLELPQKLQRYNELVSPKAREDRKELDTSSKAAAGFFAYLTRNGAPQTFLRFHSNVGEGCEYIGFSLNLFYFRVGVALVQNKSPVPVTIDGLTGNEEPAATVRRAGQMTPAAHAPLAAGPATLEPGETLIVPLRLNLEDLMTDPPDLDAETKAAMAENLAEAKKSYERIRATKPGTKFRILVETDIRNNRPRGSEPNTYWIVKTREAFTPHTEPEIQNYVYGPEWQLSAVTVAGEIIPLEEAETDVVSFTADGGAGSCPVLYVWSEDDQHWERRGKVIHKAQGKANAQSETVRFSGWQPRFKIVEEELEVAHLDAISAVISLDDGTTRDLAAPKAEMGGELLTFPVSYYYAEGTEVEFALPEGVTPERVTETRLTVSGYYERYSSLLVEKYSRAREAEPKSAVAID